MSSNKWNLASESSPKPGEIVEVIRRDGIQMDWQYYPHSDIGGNNPIWESSIIFWRYNVG